MAESRSKKVSVIIFLLAVFVLLSVFTGTWIYKIYKEQTQFTTATTLAAVECGKYYFRIDESTVNYAEGQLFFELENMMGSEIQSIFVESGPQQVKVDIYLGPGTSYPIAVPINISDSIKIYPEGCGDVNFKNITFDPPK